MSIPLQFVSLHDDQEVFMWSDCLLDLGQSPIAAKERLPWTIPKE